MIDIKVLKLYPLGFIENGEEGWEKGPWNRVEEEEKQRIWMVRYSADPKGPICSRFLRSIATTGTCRREGFRKLATAARRSQWSQ